MCKTFNFLFYREQIRIKVNVYKYNLISDYLQSEWTTQETSYSSIHTAAIILYSVGVHKLPTNISAPMDIVITQQMQLWLKS